MSDRPAEMAVLLVDDDAEWVATAGAALESADDALSVITATGGWEALDLLEGERFDCVVCDYRMPDFDGIALLERIRAQHGDVPFILITGAGSEAVASRAISSRVTDYFIKEPERDQSRALAMRIRSAVEAHRTEQALEAARKRFTELFESVPDPVAITDERGAVLAVNDAFAGLVGVDADDVEGEPLDAVVEETEVHTGAANEEAADERAADDGRTPDDDAEVRLLGVETARGRREFLVRRFPLERPEVREFCHVFTDVTNQRERERELERFHELSADVRELLLSSESREELEGAFCDAIVSTIEGASAMFARGGTPDEVTVRATAGDVDDRLERALFDVGGGDAEDDGHPVRAALASGDAQYVGDVSGMDAEWAASARSDDAREVLVLPVERAGMPAGAFVVCTPTPSTLDDVRRERLAGLVSSLGDAIDLVDRVTALAADHVVRVTLTVGDDGALLNSLTAETAAAVDVVSAIPRDDGTALYLEFSSEDVDHVLARLDGRDGVDGGEVIVRDDGRARVRAVASTRTPTTVLVRQPVAVCSIRSEDGRTTASFDVPLSGDVRDVVDAIEGAFGDVSVDGVRTIEREHAEAGDGSPLRDLTDKQRRALETAFHEGYFERPRAQSADEVAASLGVSRSTFLQHLRAAERKLLADLFGWEPSRLEK